MSTAAERAEAEAKAKAAEADGDDDAPPAKVDAPVQSCTLRPAQWDVDAVEFAYDGDTVTVPKSGYKLPAANADAVVAAAADAGFALTKES